MATFPSSWGWTSLDLSPDLITHHHNRCPMSLPFTPSLQHTLPSDQGTAFVRSIYNIRNLWISFQAVTILFLDVACEVKLFIISMCKQPWSSPQISFHIVLLTFGDLYIILKGQSTCFPKTAYISRKFNKCWTQYGSLHLEKRKRLPNLRKLSVMTLWLFILIWLLCPCLLASTLSGQPDILRANKVNYLSECSFLFCLRQPWQYSLFSCWKSDVSSFTYAEWNSFVIALFIWILHSSYYECMCNVSVCLMLYVYVVTLVSNFYTCTHHDLYQ